MIYNNRGNIKIYNKDKWENIDPKQKFKTVNGESILGEGNIVSGIIDVDVLPSGWKGTPVPNEGYKVEINTNAIYRLPNETLWVYQGDWVELVTADPDLSLNEPYYISEEEADIILKFSDFTQKDITKYQSNYTITLRSEEINGKKIRFYYDEKDLTDLIENINEMSNLTFQFDIIGKINKPFKLYSEYYGGNSNEIKVIMIFGKGSEFLSLMEHHFDLVSESHNQTIVHPNPSYFVTAIVSQTNMRCFLDASRYYTNLLYGDPDA